VAVVVAEVSVFQSVVNVIKLFFLPRRQGD
jgi:hypothetical protein